MVIFRLYPLLLYVTKTNVKTRILLNVVSKTELFLFVTDYPLLNRKVFIDILVIVRTLSKLDLLTIDED